MKNRLATRKVSGGNLKIETYNKCNNVFSILFNFLYIVHTNMKSSGQLFHGASDWGLGGDFRRALLFPPPGTTG